MPRSPRLLALALLLLPACGGSADPAELTKAGERALGSQDFAGALTDFESACAAIGDDASHAYYLRAHLGAIEARAATDATKAKNDLVTLADAQPGKVTDEDYNRIATRMSDAGKIREAIALLEIGKAAYPESAHLDKLGMKLASDAEKADDPEALEALKGMGYVGE